MSADESDDTLVRAEHVQAFVDWYRGRVQAPPITFAIEWWTNALTKGLTLGELRNGIRALQRFESKLVLSPVEFWHLCKGKQDEATIQRFRKLRETVRNSPITSTKENRA